MKLPSISFRCECTPKKYQPKGHAKPLVVINMGDNEIEIGGVYLKAKSVQKLLKFLLESRRGEAIIKLGKIT